MTTLTTRPDRPHRTDRPATHREQPAAAQAGHAPPKPPESGAPEPAAPAPEPKLRSDFLFLLLHPDYHAELLASVLNTPLHELAGALSAAQASEAIDDAIEIADRRLRLIRAEAERAAWARLLELTASNPLTATERETSRKAASHILRLLTKSPPPPPPNPQDDHPERPPPTKSPDRKGGDGFDATPASSDQASTHAPNPQPDRKGGDGFGTRPSQPHSRIDTPSPAPAGEGAEQSKAGGGLSEVPPPLPPAAGEDRGEGSRSYRPPSHFSNSSPAPAPEVAERSEAGGGLSNNVLNSAPATNPPRAPTGPDPPPLTPDPQSTPSSPRSPSSASR